MSAAPKSTAKRSAKAASTVTDTVPVPETLPETITETPALPASDSPAAMSPASPAADAPKPKSKPLKVQEAKVAKWIDNLQKAQEAGSIKLVASVLSGLQTLLASKNGSASKNGARNLSGYNKFVQQHIKDVAAANPDKSNKEIMKLIAIRWQEEKAKLAAASA